MVNSVTTNTAGTSSTTTSASTTTTSKSTMGKDDFFKLLISQMKNQDPLNPSDSTQFAAQLAQFSSLEQMQNINTNLTSSLNANYTLSQSINNTMAATFIGKEAKLSGGTFTYTGQDSIKLGYDITNIAKNVNIKVYNSTGSLVQTFKASDVDKGTHTVDWDFKNSAGTSVAQGTYTFKVEATANNGDTLKPTIFKYGSINGVKYTDSGTKLLVGNSEYNLSDILEILNPGSTTGGK